MSLRSCDMHNPLAVGATVARTDRMPAWTLESMRGGRRRHSTRRPSGARALGTEPAAPWILSGLPSFDMKSCNGVRSTWITVSHVCTRRGSGAGSGESLVAPV